MKSNRRKFLTKSTVVAAAVALPSTAAAQTTAGEKPVKKVPVAKPRPEPIDIKAGFDFAMKRYPKIIARLAK